MGTTNAILSGTILTEADKRYTHASILVSHLDLVNRGHHVLATEQAYRVDLCITPRLPSRMRFERWNANRFENPGRLFVIPPEEKLDVWNDLGQESVVVVHLFLDAISRMLEEDVAPNGDRIERSIDISNGAIEQVMLRLREEVCTPGFASDLMIEGLALQLAAELQRHYRNNVSLTGNGGLSPWRLRRIEERIRSSVEVVTLSELANLCDLSVRQLSRAYRSSTGNSIGQYVANVRIERAKEILGRERSIKRVAALMGFSSTAAFSFAFRKATGVTPSAYRRMTL